MQIQNTHTHASHCLSCLHRIPMGPPPLHYPSFITFTFCLSILLSSLPFRFSVFLSFARSPPPFPQSHVGRRVADQTCNNMPASPRPCPRSPLHAVASVPRSPSIHHPSTVPVVCLSNRSDSRYGHASWPKCLRHASSQHLPQPFVKLRYIGTALSAPLRARVSHDRLYGCFCAPGQLCLGLSHVCLPAFISVESSISVWGCMSHFKMRRALMFYFMRLYIRLSFAMLYEIIAHAEHVITLNKEPASTHTACSVQVRRLAVNTQ